jgi:hypothetical protein
MIFQQPVDAVGRAAFFVGREREDQIARGPVALLFEADERGDQQRVWDFISCVPRP